jgi:hypothetical protein
LGDALALPDRRSFRVHASTRLATDARVVSRASP